MAEIRDLLMRFRGDSSGAEEAAKKVQKSLDATNKLADQLGKAFGRLTVAAAAYATYKFFDRGQEVSEITTAFKNLETVAGRLADGELAKLRESTQGLVSDLDLMKAANQALLAGLTPEQFSKVAEAADTLGDAVGKGTTEAVNDLSFALQTGNERLLKQYGIIINTQQAEDKFAKSIGTTRDRLNEAGKLESSRIAILAAISEKTKQIGQANVTAGDGIQRVTASIANFVDRLAQSVNENEALSQSFDDISRAVQQIDLKPFIEGMRLAANATAAVIDGINQFSQRASALYEVTFNTTARAKFADLPGELKATQDEINRLEEDQKQRVANGYPESLGGQQGIAVARKKLAELQGSFDALKKAQEDEQKAAQGSVKTMETVVVTADRLSSATDKSTSKFIDNSKGAKEAADQLKKIQEQAEKARQAFQDFTRDSDLSFLVDGQQKLLDAAANSLDPVKFQSALEKYGQALYDQTYDKLKKAYGDGVDDAAIQTRASTEVQRTLDEVTQQFGKGLEEKTNEAFKNSAAFFEDLFYNVFTGTAFSLGDALKRVAAGFAGNMAASLSQSLGVNVGTLGNAQGLGGALAQIVLGRSSFGALLGTAGATTATASAGAGIAGAGAGLGNVGAAGGAGAGLGAAGSLTPFLPAIAAAVGAVLAGRTIYNAGQDLFSSGGNRTRGGINAALSSNIITLPFAVGADVLGVNFGGIGRGGREAQQREAALNALKDRLGSGLSFSGVGGQIKLDSGAYNLGSGLAQQAAGLTGPLARLISGDNDKIKNDLTAIFANATASAKNFNEVIVNSSALMDKLGFNADDAKKQLSDLFLDGKLKLDEFSAGISNLNLLSQQDLVGPNSVSDALRIVAENMSNPRTALKGLELAFKEMGQVGIDTQTEVSAYLSDRFGPSAVAIFDQLRAAGIDTWEEVKNASADQIALIFNVLTQFKDDFQNIFSQLGDTGAKALNLSPITDKLKVLREAADQTGDTLKKSLTYNAGGRYRAGVDPNPVNNSRPA